LVLGFDPKFQVWKEVDRRDADSEIFLPRRNKLDFHRDFFQVLDGIKAQLFHVKLGTESRREKVEEIPEDRRILLYIAHFFYFMQSNFSVVRHTFLTSSTTNLTPRVLLQCSLKRIEGTPFLYKSIKLLLKIKDMSSRWIIH
jgi:hypothetical protein